MRKAQVCMILLAGVFIYVGIMIGGNQNSSIVNAAETNKFVGVWFYYFWDTVNHTGHSPRWITIFDNGEAYEDIAIGGYLHFNKDASKKNKYQANYWGTYIVKGNECTITRPGVINPRKLTLTKENEIHLDTGEYAYRVPNVDGFRLEGSWTTSSDKSRKFINSFKDGERPLLTLSKDGTFRDYGQFINKLLWASSRKAGRGTYEITNYTLVLKYDDQASAELAFSLFGSNMSDPPASDPTLLFLDRHTMYKAE